MKESGDLPACTDISLKSFHEGLAVQFLHTGPTEDEPRVRARLLDFVVAQGYQSRGEPHTIYLQDPGETEDRLMRAVIRQPIAAVSP